METAKKYMERWPVNPLQFPVAETIQALRHFKEFPFDLSQLNGVPVVSNQEWIVQRVNVCLSLTTGLIQ